MTTIENALSFLAIIGIYLVIYQGLSSLFLESGRQKIFIIRDHIFDYATEHRDRIDASQHEEIRSFLNRTILAMQYTTILRVIIASIFYSKSNSSNYEDVTTPLYKQIQDKEAQAFIKAQIKKVLPIIITTMLFRAPITFIVLVLVAIVFIVIDFISPIKKRTKARVENKVKNTVFDNLDHSYS